MNRRERKSYEASPYIIGTYGNGRSINQTIGYSVFILRCLRCSFLLALLALSISSVAIAESRIVFRYSTDPKPRITGVAAIVNLEEPYKECDQRIADLVVDEVVYDGSSGIIVGFRAQKPSSKTSGWNFWGGFLPDLIDRIWPPKSDLGSREWYGLFAMKGFYMSLANAERGHVGDLVKKGAKLIVSYQICGSGSFVSVRDIYDKATINNP